MQARVRSPVAWPSGPLFPTAERGVECFQCQVFLGVTAGSAPLRAQLQASCCCQLCPKQRSKALRASSSHEHRKDHRNRDRVLTLETTSDRPEVSPTRPAPLRLCTICCQSAMQARVRSPEAWPSGPLFPTAERGVECFHWKLSSAKYLTGGTVGSAPLRAQLLASCCCQLCPKQKSKALWASSGHEHRKGHRNRVLTLGNHFQST